MDLTNKNYVTKWSRWYWYEFFLILFNIVFPVLFQSFIIGLIIIEEDLIYLRLIPIIVLLITLSSIFIKETLKRKSGFSVLLLIATSLVYFIYYLLFLIAMLDIIEYYEINVSEFAIFAIFLPFIIGPLMLLENFVISHMYHKKGSIPADQKSTPLKIFGISSVFVSLFLPFIIVAIILIILLIGIPNYTGNNYERKKYTCKNCGSKVDINSSFCPKCGSEIKLEKQYTCKNCGSKVDINSNFCPKCGLDVKNTKKTIN